MNLSRLFRFHPPTEPAREILQVGARAVPLLFVRHPRARRYKLRLNDDGTARVTIPRGGAVSAAKDFVSRNLGWLEKQLQRLAAQPKEPSGWTVGTEILFRGEPVRLERDADGAICFGTEKIVVPDSVSDLRPVVQTHLWRMAARELPPRVMEFAAQHGFAGLRVSVRNQRSRWGSCSRRGTISLNWRLIQAPVSVRDYIILHELAHRRHMNHSRRFWEEVERLCPDYAQAESWLRRNCKLLR